MRERFGRLGIELRSRARDQARWLIRDHGDEAEAVLADKLRRPGNSAADRYRFRCTGRELDRLREIEGRERQTSLTLWKPSALGGLMDRLLGRKRKRRRDR